MNSKNFIFLFGLSFSTLGFASNYLMFIGAGGEPANKETTLFDGSIKNISEFVKKSPGIKIDIALNGGHKQTEELINSSFPTAASKSNFHSSDYDRLIESYKTKLENNEMVAGDQMLIYIDSHGAEKSPNSKSHVIATAGAGATNLNTLAGSTNVNLDRLEVLKDLAKSKGVKMAIIDSSCHSGNTQALADENTCVISSTGPKHYGYAIFSQIFSKAMEKGKTLEEIYLASRKLDTTPSLPMISSPAGQEVSGQLYEKITPFLYHFDNENDKLTPYLQTQQGNEAQCIANFDSLIETMDQVEKLNTETKKILWWKTQKKKVKLTKLKNLVSKYQNSMLQIQSKTKALDAERLNRKENFQTPSQSVAYTWRELLSTDFNKNIRELEERLPGESNPYNINLLKDLITVYTNANAKKDELLTTHPDLQGIPALEQSIRNSIQSNYFTAAAIGAEERKLYSALYDSAQENYSSAAPNPCRDFKL